jgi:hypothetical protein
MMGCGEERMGEERMPGDIEGHHRRSIRLPGYDYAQAGAYFVTLCTQGRVPLFGDIVGEAMRLNLAGEEVQAAWEQLPSRYPCVISDAFVVMPNHVHGILILTGADSRRGEPRVRPGSITGEPSIRPFIQGNDKEGDEIHGDDAHRGDHEDRPYEGGARGTLPGSLGRIIQGFKSITTNAYIRGVHQRGWATIGGFSLRPLCRNHRLFGDFEKTLAPSGRDYRQQRKPCILSTL